MSNMEVEQIDEQYITIYFDNDHNAQFPKSFLVQHSQYFEAMFSGKFMESQSGSQIRLKDVNFKGFTNVIECLKQHRIIFDCIEDLLLLLEISQILQFPFVIEESMFLIKEKFMFTNDAVLVFSLASKLGLQELYEQSRIYILYNFKTIFVQNRNSFFKLNASDLQHVLCDNGLNVDHERDVYDLVIEWCSETSNDDIEYEMAVNCVHFSCMGKNQLQYCFLKANNLELQNTIKEYMNTTNENKEIAESIRSVPHVLCGIKNEEDGQAYIYRWDSFSLKFTKFLKVCPLPLYSTGYHVVIKDLDIFVLAGEVGYGRGVWNETGWKYSLVTKVWRHLSNFVPCKRRHGLGYFCGDELHLMGGLTTHRLNNDLVEMFRYDKKVETFVQVKSYICDFFPKNIDRKSYTCLEYEGQLVLITKEFDPLWYKLREEIKLPRKYRWDSYQMNLKAILLCAITYNNGIYLIAYNRQKMISLYQYYPKKQSCRRLKRFKTVYKQGSTMCAFNINKAMIFSECTLECYHIDNDTYKEYLIELDSFHANYFFNVPIY